MVELDRSASLLQINVNEILFTFANGDRGLDVAVSGGDSVMASAAGAAGSATGAAVAVAAAGAGAAAAAAAVAAAGWLLASPDEGRRACPISCRWEKIFLLNNQPIYYLKNNACLPAKKKKEKQCKFAHVLKKGITSEYSEWNMFVAQTTTHVLSPCKFAQS